MPLHPQVEALLAQMSADGAPPIGSMSVADARGMALAMTEAAGAPAAIADVGDVTIPVDGGSIALRAYTPLGTGPFPIVVFYHGGGWVIGDLESHDPLCRHLCAGSGALVVAVDYRLAPEHRFPTAAHDAFAALQWVAANGAALAGDPSRLAVCGDSAGGNLSAVVSQMARDAGGPALAYAALIYPGTDMTAEDASMVENGTGYLLEKDDMEWFMSHYLSADDRANPLASPALAANFTGLPPCFITTCEFDPLRDQGEAYGDKLRAAGVAAEVKRYPGLIHAAASLAGVLDGGAEMVADVSTRLRTALRVG